MHLSINTVNLQIILFYFTYKIWIHRSLLPFHPLLSFFYFYYMFYFYWFYKLDYIVTMFSPLIPLCLYLQLPSSSILDWLILSHLLSALYIFFSIIFFYVLSSLHFYTCICIFFLQCQICYQIPFYRQCQIYKNWNTH